MIDPANVPAVSPNEVLARFVTQSGQFRLSNMSVKADLFIPPSSLLLSVTRHLQNTDSEIWVVGRSVASVQGRTLYGRADIEVAECLSNGLHVKAEPVTGNPNHADISGWPIAKEDRKANALRLAAAARFIAIPGSA